MFNLGDEVKEKYGYNDGLTGKVSYVCRCDSCIGSNNGLIGVCFGDSSLKYFGAKQLKSTAPITLNPEDYT